MPGFLAQEDIVPVKLPSRRSPRKATVLREEIASSQLSFKTEIDQFHFEEERKEQKEPVVQVSDSEDKLDKSSGVHTPRFIVARVDDSLEEEKEEEMALNRKKGLSDLLADRAKGSTPKNASGFHPPLSLPPLPPPTVNLFAIGNIKKKRKEKELAKEGGGVSPLKRA